MPGDVVTVTPVPDGVAGDLYAAGVGVAGDFTRDADLRRSRLGRAGGRGRGDALEARLILMNDDTAEGVFGLHFEAFFRSSSRRLKSRLRSSSDSSFA